MPLSTEPPAAVRYLVPGAAAGLVAFAFSRVMIEPLIGAAVDYEGVRAHAEAQLIGGDHEHGHEIFTRAVQQNVGAAVGVIAFSVVMGVLFAVAYATIRAALSRCGYKPHPSAMALLLSAGMFVAIGLMPSLKYPASPPTVGLEETVQERSSAFLTITVISVVTAAAAVATAMAWSRRWGIWPAAALAVGAYLAVMVGAMVLLPNFDEVPGPLTGPDGIVLDGFPAGALADFRVFSLVNQGLLWLVIGATAACLTALWPSIHGRRIERAATTDAHLVSSR